MLSGTQLLLVCAALLPACNKSLDPVDPVWGKQACESCRMLVSDPFYAAELVDDRGQRHFFDDIGCLDAYLAERPRLTARAMWVHSGSRWVEAASARYTSGAASPMAYGFAAQELGPLDFAGVRRAAAAHRKESSP
jgi:copper chaperone NosL